MKGLGRAAAYALVVVLTVELAVWGSFLVESRPFGHAFPMAALIAGVGNIVLGRAGARVLDRRLGAIIPAVVWLLIALSLGSTKGEGDLIVTGDFRGVAFLVLGTLTAVAAAGATPAAPRSR